MSTISTPYLDVLFCHECDSRYYRYERGIACPECGSTELIEDSVDSQKALSRTVEGGTGS